MNGDPDGANPAFIEAVEWLEKAPGGGSGAQVFRLVDNRFAIVKFQQNPQGQIVLASEFLCCQLAEDLNLPINNAVIVMIDDALLPPAKQQGMPANFSAGLACGMIRFANTEGGDIPYIKTNCSNRDQLHDLVAFEELVCRKDGRQLLVYTPEGGREKRFAAYDYGHAFGGEPVWSAATLAAIPQVLLPANDPFTNETYADGSALAALTNRLRNLTKDHISEICMRIAPTRWGVTPEDIQAAMDFVDARSKSLVQQFDQKYSRSQLEIPNV